MFFLFIGKLYIYCFLLCNIFEYNLFCFVYIMSGIKLYVYWNGFFLRFNVVIEVGRKLVFRYFIVLFLRFNVLSFLFWNVGWCYCVMLLFVKIMVFKLCNFEKILGKNFKLLLFVLIYWRFVSGFKRDLMLLLFYEFKFIWLIFKCRRFFKFLKICRLFFVLLNFIWILFIFNFFNDVFSMGSW